MILIRAFTHVLHQARLRSPAFALLAVLAGAGCDNNDPVATSAPSDPSALSDSSAPSAPSDSNAAPSDELTDGVTAVTPEQMAVVYRGLPYGPFSLWSGYTTIAWGPAPFTSSINATDAYGIIRQINAARSKGQRLVLAMTGGSHSQYKTNGKFDLAKWKARMNTYNRADIKAAVAAGVADRTVTMNMMLDDVHVPSWGGVLTKPLIDQMSVYVKSMFPTLPTAVTVHYAWRNWERYRKLDAIYTQYTWWRGNVTEYRDKALAQARLDGVAVAFGLNILDGGIHNNTTKLCPIPLTGGYGTFVPACRMTASQVRSWGLTLGPAGCALFMWRYDATFFSKWANVQAFKDVAVKLASLGSRNCRRA